MGKSIEIIPDSVMNALQNYHWPGNIRELENVLERAVINSSGTKLHLVDELKRPREDLSCSSKTLEAVERDHIVRILEQTQWKVSGKKGRRDPWTQPQHLAGPYAQIWYRQAIRPLAVR